MTRLKRLLSACWFWPLLAPLPASALTVDIQGVHLEIEIAGASCVEIAGSYPGVRIESSQSGKIPRVCYNSNSKVNSISLLDTLLVAAAPSQKEVLVKFEHEFPTGINGKIMSRAKLQGFFSTLDGVGIPSGDKLSFSAFFSQAGHDDAIAEPLDLAVGDSMDSAMIDYSAKEQYLASGPRKLKGVLAVSFGKSGDKLTLADKHVVSLDSGSTMADKLEAMEPETEPEPEGGQPAEPPDENAAPKTPRPAAAPAKQKPDLPAELPMDPAPSTAPPGDGAPAAKPGQP